MAEPLKLRFGAPVVREIATLLHNTHAAFDAAQFTHDCLQGFDALALMPRARQVAEAMHRHLPTDFAVAGPILLHTLGQPVTSGPFLWWPHGMFIASHGLGHFELAMRLQHALTQRFTAEFSLRAFLQHHPAATLARLVEWARDPSEHVRRLVSEGSRPRLPWAPRLLEFQRDPRPGLALLELLKDDPSLYVRRSVANHLNDIGKDHPAVLMDTAERWLGGASPERQWIVRHALRVAIKQGHPDALRLMGHGHRPEVSLRAISITPQRVAIGGAVEVSFKLFNPSHQTQSVLVDLQFLYRKAHGGHSPKVFKLKTLSLAPQQSALLRKRQSVADMSTRRHHPGAHHIAALVNGQAMPLGSFELLPG
jgi:3-methyladenine DNA glycosylase AlkC